MKQHFFTFLMGLNSIYQSVRSRLLHRENKPSLEEAIGVIRQAESRIRVTPKSQVQNFAALLTKKPETRAALLEVGQRVHQRQIQLQAMKERIVEMHYCVPTARSIDKQRKIARSLLGRIRMLGRRHMHLHHSHRTLE